MYKISSVKIRKETLDNGIILYKIKKPEAKTIGISINVKIGSIYEDKDKRGISHFLEHMMFKSNKKYSAQQISMGLELNGGIANAFTSTFLTSYFAEVIPQGFENVIDILFSMFENEKFDQTEFEKEKKVVLSEIERYENNPEELMDRLIPKAVFGSSDYGDPVGGYRETVESISKEDLEEFKAKYYASNNMFIILEGNFSQKHINLVKKYFSKLDEGKINKKKPTISKGEDIIKEANTKNQIYFSMNYEIKFSKDNFHLPIAFSEIISGGLSSLLFNVIREKYGIGYSLYFEPTYIYEDRMIISLAIPGFEKEKEKLLDNALKDLSEEINSKNFSQYVEKRKKRVLLKFKKLENNIFERLRKEPFLIFVCEETFENLYKKIINIDSEEIQNFYNSLRDYKIVKLL
ncbi:MAG: pitrilysin family protein [Candidatus Aenigmatarchaeota archaeon]